MSPHQLGIPQLRERIYILGVKKEIYNKELHFKIPIANKQNLDVCNSNIFDIKFIKNIKSVGMKKTYYSVGMNFIRA